jgi:hypothetical protein
MSAAEITKRIAPSQPRLRSTIIGVYYLFTISTGAFIVFFHGRVAVLADLAVGIFYLTVTAFLYGLTGSANSRKERVRKEEL